MFLYLLSVTCCWAVFYAIYHVLLRRETFHAANRIYLLGTLLLGAVLPALGPLVFPEHAPDIEITYLQPLASELQPYLFAPVATEYSGQATEVPRTVVPWWQTLLWLVYWTGVLIALGRLLLGAYRIVRLRTSSEREQYPDYELVRTNEDHAPFSFWRSIFRSRLRSYTPTEWDQMLTHELVHVRQRHSFDLLLVELLGLLQWFSIPLWGYRIALRDVHEYLADERTARTTGTRRYGELLLKHAHNSVPALGHGFHSSQLKKRFRMMTKIPSATHRCWRLFLVAPLTLLLLYGFGKSKAPESLPPSQEVSENFDVTRDTFKDEVFKIVEEMPRFGDCTTQACSNKKMLEFVTNNLRYPAQDIEKGREGRAVIRMIIERDGSISDAEILRDPGGELGAEALRIVRSMPDWQPGKQRGNAVRVQYNIPISFKLDGETSGRAVIPPPPPPPPPPPRSHHPELFKVVEEMPRFPGCEDEPDRSERKKCSEKKLFEFIKGNMEYPPEAREAGVEGTAVVRFLVEKDGQLTDIQVLRDPGAGTGAEARRIIESMPNWVPGTQRGQTVRVQYNLPVRFKLEPEPSPLDVTNYTITVEAEKPGEKMEEVLGGDIGWGSDPVIFLDGLRSTRKQIDELPVERVEQIDVIKNKEELQRRYPGMGYQSVILVTTRQGKKPEIQPERRSSKPMKDLDPSSFGDKVLVLMDGEEIEESEIKTIPGSLIGQLQIIKGQKATNKRYPGKNYDAVIMITSRNPEN